MRRERESAAGEYRKAFVLIRQTGTKWWEENKGGGRKYVKQMLRVMMVILTWEIWKQNTVTHYIKD